LFSLRQAAPPLMFLAFGARLFKIVPKAALKERHGRKHPL
jgi:hypothetical protein